MPYNTLQNQNLKSDTDFNDAIDSIAYSGHITLFDEIGVFLEISSKVKFLLQFWCENDGGIQFRPTLQTKIKKDELLRPLNAIDKIQSIGCFAMVNRSPNGVEATETPTDKTIELQGNFDSDGKIDCFIWTIDDDTMNCGGNPENNLNIFLRVGKKDYRLRCCGP